MSRIALSYFINCSQKLEFQFQGGNGIAHLPASNNVVPTAGRKDDDKRHTLVQNRESKVKTCTNIYKRSKNIAKNKKKEKKEGKIWL